MLEGSVMEYVKWFVMVMGVFFITTVVILMFRVNEINSFQQEVNYQIERHGGLTDEAIADLDSHVKDAYGSCVIELVNGEAPTNIPENCNSPFYLKEYLVNENGSENWYSRGNNKAGFGTQIHYAIVRHVGSIGQIGNIGDGDITLLKPTLIGTSISRIRGN